MPICAYVPHFDPGATEERTNEKGRQENFRPENFARENLTSAQSHSAFRPLRLVDKHHIALSYLSSTFVNP